MLRLAWIKCGNPPHWCSFEKLKVESIGDVTRVYVIRHGGPPPNCVRIGQGNIADRLAEHRNDPDILAYRQLGLFVTWTRVSSERTRRGSNVTSPVTSNH